MFRVIFFAMPFILLVTPLFAKNSLTLFYDYVEDSNNRIFRDKTLYVNYKKIYAVRYISDWQEGWEIGGTWIDTRRGAYSSYIRIKEFDTSYQIATEQPLKQGFVAKAQLRFVHVSKPERLVDKTNLWVYGFGFDKYYGDYHYFSLLYSNDPRASDRFLVTISNTLATEHASVRVGFVPRSDGKNGYFSIIKYRWLILGYAQTREFDFATFDRKVFTFGLSIPFERFFPLPTWGGNRINTTALPLKKDRSRPSTGEY